MGKLQALVHHLALTLLAIRCAGCARLAVYRASATCAALDVARGARLTLDGAAAASALFDATTGGSPALNRAVTTGTFPKSAACRALLAGEVTIALGAVAQGTACALVAGQSAVFTAVAEHANRRTATGVSAVATLAAAQTGRGGAALDVTGACAARVLARGV